MNEDNMTTEQKLERFLEAWEQGVMNRNSISLSNVEILLLKTFVEYCNAIDMGLVR
jgi:hypothetical protein